MTPKWNSAYGTARHAIGDAIEDDYVLVNDSLGTISFVSSDGMDEEKETGDAKTYNFPTRED